MREIEEFLAGLGWKRSWWCGELWYIADGIERAVHLPGTQLRPWWDLRHFTDGDIDGVAVGRYVSDEEGTTLSELRAAMEACGLKVTA